MEIPGTPEERWSKQRIESVEITLQEILLRREGEVTLDKLLNEESLRVIGEDLVRHVIDKLSKEGHITTYKTQGGDLKIHLRTHKHNLRKAS